MILFAMGVVYGVFSTAALAAGLCRGRLPSARVVP